MFKMGLFTWCFKLVIMIHMINQTMKGNNIMLSKKLISLSFICCSLSLGNSAALPKQQSVVKIINKGSYAVNATQTVAVPSNMQATITTELAAIGFFSNIQLELLKAILKDDAGLIKSIILAGANINQEIGAEKPLAIAAINRKPKAFQALLESGADFNIMCGSEKLVFYCIINLNNSFSCDCNNCCTSCNNCCSMPCNDSSCSVHGCNDSNEKNIKPATLLIKKGADLSGWPYSEDIMYWALQGNSIELIAELIKRGYEPNRITNITCVRLQSFPKILEFFLKNGLNPNAEIEREVNSQMPWTPLTMALQYGCIQSVKLLLEAGADPHLAGPQLPLDYAIKSGNLEAIELLMQYEAKLLI